MACTRGCWGSHCCSGGRHQLQLAALLLLLLLLLSWLCTLLPWRQPPLQAQLQWACTTPPTSAPWRSCTRTSPASLASRAPWRQCCATAACAWRTLCGALALLLPPQSGSTIASAATSCTSSPPWACTACTASAPMRALGPCQTAQRPPACCRRTLRCSLLLASPLWPLTPPTGMGTPARAPVGGTVACQGALTFISCAPWRLWLRSGLLRGWLAGPRPSCPCLPWSTRAAPCGGGT